MKKSLIATSILLGTTFTFAFDFSGLAKGVAENVSKTATNTTTSTKSSNLTDTSDLENSTVASGLKEALKAGVNYAVTQLGSNNGYLNNSSAKIPLPDNLAKAETLLRRAGGDEMANNLISSMNTAATKAAPKTAEIFVSAIDKMSVKDAESILAGGDNAATNYFKTNTTKSLQTMIKPIIQETMKENKVASYYDTANSFFKSNVGGLTQNSNLTGLAKNFGVDSYIPGNSDQNLDDYVTEKAIEGLFSLIAVKEAEIRKNPVAQTSSLLKQVFGN